MAQSAIQCPPPQRTMFVKQVEASWIMMFLKTWRSSLRDAIFNCKQKSNILFFSGKKRRKTCVECSCKCESGVFFWETTLNWRAKFKISAVELACHYLSFCISTNKKISALIFKDSLTSLLSVENCINWSLTIMGEGSDVRTNWRLIRSFLL